MTDKPEAPVTTHIYEMEALCDMYFPNQTEVGEFADECRNYLIEVLRVHSLSIQGDKQAWGKFDRQAYTTLNNAKAGAIEACAAQLMQIAKEAGFIQAP